jgi:hypothetical protein
LSDFPQPILTIHERALYVGTVSTMVALDAGSGNEIWHVHLGHNMGTSSIVIDSEVASYLGAIGVFYEIKCSRPDLQDRSSFVSSLFAEPWPMAAALA